MTETSIGNSGLLSLHKTAFLCSRKIPASAVLKCYDWAIAQREAGNCVISGFHSQIEKDVLHYLLKGQQPIILVLARGMKEKTEPEFVKPLSEGRLLIISPFEKTTRRVTKKTSELRNKIIIQLADNITVGYARAGGQIEKIFETTNKPIYKIT